MWGRTALLCVSLLILLNGLHVSRAEGEIELAVTTLPLPQQSISSLGAPVVAPLLQPHAHLLTPFRRNITSDTYA